MKIKSLLISTTVILTVAIATLFAPGCNQIENLSNSGSQLLVDLIVGKDLEGNLDSTVIFSDVITTSGTVFNDNGTVTLTAKMLNPMAETPTHYHDIIIEQIDVEYSRADGLSVQGVDIPFHFSQKVSARIPIDKTVDVAFVVVQHNAKSEMPLVGLKNMGQEHILKLEAKITIHGKDASGTRIEPAVGYISIWCANFGDED